MKTPAGHDQPEQLIPLREVPQLLPRRRGKKLHYSTVYRWATKGARGRVLATRLLGGIRYTTHEALGQFLSGSGPDHKTDQQRDDLRRALYGDRQG